MIQRVELMHKDILDRYLREHLAKCKNTKKSITNIKKVLEAALSVVKVSSYIMCSLPIGIFLKHPNE